jgi:hypothetical protein
MSEIKAEFQLFLNLGGEQKSSDALKISKFSEMHNIPVILHYKYLKQL